MTANMYRTWADDDGAWCEGTSGNRHGIRWDEVYAVSGYKLDGIPEVYTVICLDFSFGEFVEIDNTMPGFDEVVRAIHHCLPGIDANWFEKIESRTPGESAETVWEQGSA